MKVLILMPRNYSLLKTLQYGFEENNVEVVTADIQDFFSKRVNRFVNRFESLPNRVKKTWKEPYIRKLNEGYLALAETEKPDYVLVYNNQLLLPETLKQLKQKSRIIFFLGDHPLYTPTFEYNLTILYQADYILCPDTFWIQQLERIGVKNLHFTVFGFDDRSFYPFTPSAAQQEQYGCELAYVGTAQKGNWGYKRFLFLNLFRNLDLKAYITGDGYERKWKAHFPELASHIIPYQQYDPAFNNLLCNCARLYPIDLVPSLFNGIHIRIMDCIGSGILPLLEHSADTDKVFEGVDIPLIREYDKAESMARYYLANEGVRERLSKDLRSFVMERYAPARIICDVLSHIN